MSAAPAHPVLAHHTLGELEDVIERGLASFVDVANALLQVKAGRLYKDAGYPTFEEYCNKRWNMSRTYGHRLIVGAATVEALANSEMLPRGNILPATEKQARPLSVLPDAEKAEAWKEAVEQAGGQPTAAQVQAAVDQRRADPSQRAAERKPSVTLDGFPRPTPASAPRLLTPEERAEQERLAESRRARQAGIASALTLKLIVGDAVTVVGAIQEGEQIDVAPLIEACRQAIRALETIK